VQVEINTSNTLVIDWGATGAKEIVQNVINLINMLKYEVAYDRTLGINSDFQDAPLQEAVSLAIAQIYDVIDKREPRATVEEVTFTGLTGDGNLSFKVVIEL
jgi:hypothetical protein